MKNNHKEQRGYGVLYDKFITRITKLNLKEIINVNKNIFLKIFNQIDKDARSENKVIKEYFNELFKKLEKFTNKQQKSFNSIKDSEELEKFIPTCPNCKNSLLETGNCYGHEVTNHYLACFNCGEFFIYFYTGHGWKPTLGKWKKLEKLWWGEWRE